MLFSPDIVTTDRVNKISRPTGILSYRRILQRKSAVHSMELHFFPVRYQLVLWNKKLDGLVNGHNPKPTVQRRCLQHTRLEQANTTTATTTSASGEDDEGAAAPPGDLCSSSRTGVAAPSSLRSATAAPAAAAHAFSPIVKTSKRHTSQYGPDRLAERQAASASSRCHWRTSLGGTAITFSLAGQPPRQSWRLSPTTLEGTRSATESASPCCRRISLIPACASVSDTQLGPRRSRCTPRPADTEPSENVGGTSFSWAS